mgnify:CR=1 FL=1
MISTLKQRFVIYRATAMKDSLYSENTRLGSLLSNKGEFVLQHEFAKKQKHRENINNNSFHNKSTGKCKKKSYHLQLCRTDANFQEYAIAQKPPDFLLTS